MNKFTQQFAEAKENYSDAISTFVKLANESLENAQKITALQYETASSILAQSANTAKEFFNVKTPEQASNVFKNFATFSVETTLEKSKEIFNVLNKSQSAFKNVANTSFKTASDSLLSSINKVAKVNPSWSKAAADSVQKLIDATNKAGETIEKVAEQVSTITNKNVEAATVATLNGIKKVGANSKGFAAK